MAAILKIKHGLRIVALAGLTALAGAAVGQAYDDDLKIPDNPTIYGTGDPYLHKATAIVNGEIITATDIDQRLALVKASNGGQIPAEEMQRLRLQILRNLIDEDLQIQEAKANEITIAKEEVDQTFNRVARNFKREPKDFEAYLKTQGSSAQSMRRQIEAELAWNRLLRRRVQPFVNVGEDEVRQVIKRLEEAKGTQEFRIGEIFLSATPATSEQVLANANRIMDQLRQGGSFAAYARQYSEASTAAVGGDLGWVRAAQLPSELAQILPQMQPGSISAPTAVPGGFSIIALVDQRQVLGADPRNAILNVKQITINFPANATEASAKPKVDAFKASLDTLSGCGKVEELAQSIGAEVQQNDSLSARELPPQLQQLLLNLDIGRSTPPFGSLKDGVRALVLCGRDDPQNAGAPSFDQIYQQMEDERVNLRARRYLRDLRRDAVIDYR
ncbi:peptidylprolyl isomerase [Sphingomonas sp. ID0503]|uniref:peptidylprolyl isomerase n=1 Tax=Sphingomonas sp. ID0503 TaxID=3399691 RepID=UPI003AFAF86E